MKKTTKENVKERGIMGYQKLTKEELLTEKEALLSEYEDYKSRGLVLSMARGKPSTEQLDLSSALLKDVSMEQIDEVMAKGEVDPRNYGGLSGLYSARRLLGKMVDRPNEDIIVYGNSSLNMMFDTVNRGYVKGFLGNTPWCKLDKPVKFLCPAPGYDRHFAITEYFGIEMINIPMNVDGPDMDMIEQLVSSDPYIKGIWCVPKYSNPQGYCYSDDTVKRFAGLNPAAKDFRIFWDNAYCMHDLYEGEEYELLDIIEETKKAGNEDMVFEFISMSKITFAGGSISGVATSQANLADITKTLTVQTIGYNKLTQLRHAVFFSKKHILREHMRKHANIIRPKFEAVMAELDKIADLGVGTYVKPKGGYFITYEAMDGCAKRIVQLAKEAGMTMTDAGACFPYGKDPRDSFIRIAPTFPSLDEIQLASKIFTVCVRLAAIEKLMEKE